MKVNSEVFRAYDIRGIVDEELTPKLVENIGKAIGSEVLGRKVKDINENQCYWVQKYDFMVKKMIFIMIWWSKMQFLIKN